MIFTLSPKQIESIKANSFPTFEQVDVKNVILNTSGTDSVLKLTLEVKDSKSLLKIFNNKKAQKLMRMKIFEILSDGMRNEVLSCKTVIELEETIKSYGVFNMALSPTDDFVGSKTNISEHNADSNNYIKLQYVKNIILPEEVIKYFSLGVVFYYDLEVYSKEEKVPPEFIDKSILSSDIYVFDLIKNNRSVDESVNDLRLIKSIFNRQANTNQSNLIMAQMPNNKDISNIQEFVEDKVYFAQESGLNLLNSLNSDLEIDKNSTKILSEKTKNIKLDTYFSNAYFSRNVNGNLSFLFNLDYQSLIQNNSAYKQQIINSSLKDEFSKQIKLTSFKVIRRRIKKVNNTNNSKIYFLNDTISNIAEAADSEDHIVKITKKSDIGYIKEKAVHYSKDLNSNIRTFEVIDREVFDLNVGLYQYGVELVLTDSFNSFISDKLRSALDDLKNLRSYLKDTENLIKVERKYVANEIVSSQVGYYDPTTNSFSREFVEKIFPENHAKNVSNSIANLISLLNLFGVKIAVSTSGLDLLRTFSTLLVPNFANSETINLFIKTYERYVKQIQRIISNNQSSEIKLNYWFTNEYVDASKKIGVGYEYVINEDERGLGTVTANQMQEIVTENIYKYSREDEIRDRKIDSVKYSFIAPKTVRTDNKILDLNKIIDSPDNLSQYDFIETEMDIKRFNGLGDTNQIMPVKNAPNLPDIRQQNLNLKLAALMSEFSVSVTNIFDEKPKKIELINNKSDFDAAYNASADASYLLISMSKLFDIKKGKFKQVSSEQDDFLNIEKILKQNKNYKTEIPHHLSLLISNNGKVIKSDDNYLSSVDMNSIFNLMYNTIQKVEYLEYNYNASGMIDLKNEAWKTLTEEKLREIDEENKLVLCRLRLYQNDLLKINNFDQIDLPIYNKYFILSGLDPKIEFRAPRPVEFHNFFNNIREIVDTNIVNKLQKPDTLPPLPEKLPEMNINFPKPKELITGLTPAANILAKEITKNIPLAKDLRMPNPVVEKIVPKIDTLGHPPFITRMVEKQNTALTTMTQPPAAKSVPAPPPANKIANSSPTKSPTPPTTTRLATNISSQVSKASSPPPPASQMPKSVVPAKTAMPKAGASKTGKFGK